MRNIRDFGVDLLGRMEAAGLTQTELARASGMNLSSVNSYVNGLTVPGRRNLDKLDGVLPGLADAWGETVTAYHREIRELAGQTHRENNTLLQGHGATVDKPRARPAGRTPGKKSRYGPAGSLAEVCWAARKAGMTYGQYVAKHSVSGADLQRRA